MIMATLTTSTRFTAHSRLSFRHVVRFTSFAISCAVLASLLSTAPAIAAPTTDDQVRSTQTQIKALTKDIKEMQALLRTLAKKRSKTLRGLQKLDHQIGELHTALATENTALEQTQQALAELTNKEAALEEKKQQALQALTKQLRARHQTGNTSQIKLLLQQESPQAIERHLTYYRYIFNSQNAQLDRFNALIKEIEANQQHLSNTRTQITERQAALQEKLDTLGKLTAKRKVVLAKIKKEESSRHRALKGFKKDQNELTAVLELLKLRAAQERLAKEPFKALKGRLKWPVAVNKEASFQYRRYKKGITIPTTAYSPVKTVFHGKVVFADWLRGYGLLIIVQHANDYLSLYAHNATLEKSVGDTVRTGDVIAHSGNSGELSQPDNRREHQQNRHQPTKSEQAELYFELRRAGKPINPAQWLAPKPS